MRYPQRTNAQRSRARYRLRPSGQSCGPDRLVTSHPPPGPSRRSGSFFNPAAAPKSPAFLRSLSMQRHKSLHGVDQHVVRYERQEDA